MRVTIFRAAVQVAFVLLTIVPIAVAQENNDKISVALAGDRESRSLSLTLWRGSLASVRVYSEPSHTLLGVYLNTAANFVETSGDWLAATFPREQRPERFPIMRFAFTAGQKTQMQIFEWAPVSDRAVAVYLNGIWVTGDAAQPFTEQERAVTIQTDPNRFAFSISSSLTDSELCCGEGSDCEYSCTTCKTGQTLACCFINETGCPWCSKLKAQCESCGICGG